LAQIPAENLPSQFGGKCRCQGGCELSDEGPWQDPQYLSPRQFEKMEKTKDAMKGGATVEKSEPVPEEARPALEKGEEEREGENNGGAMPVPAAA
jgi:hypothetical protein